MTLSRPHSRQILFLLGYCYSLGILLIFKIICDDSMPYKAPIHFDVKRFLLQDCTKPEQMKHTKYKRKLNIHRWFDSCTCGFTIDRGLRIYNKFPRHPEIETVIDKTEIVFNLTCSQRIFGYVSPNVTGAYKFAISSGDNSELWISRDSSPKNVELVAYVGDPNLNKQASTNLREYNKTKGQISKVQRLERGNDYYIEVLHRNHHGNGHVSIAWQIPGMISGNKFVLIDPTHLSLYLPEKDDLSSHTEHNECILKEHATLNLKVIPSVNARQLADRRDEMCTKYHILDHSLVADVLNTCPYEPSYLPKHKIPMYHGAHYYAPYWLTDFYPDDKTGDIFKDKIGNTIIDKQEVDAIVTEYMQKLRISKGQQYKLNKILNIERKTDNVRNMRQFWKPLYTRGNRYLLEMDLTTQAQDQPVRLSEYVYKYNKTYAESSGNLSTELCYPETFQWNRNAKVYIILPVQNYGYWVKYIIDELIKIYKNTPEKNFHLVVIDFNSTDFDVKIYLHNSALRNSYTFLKMDGPFIKTLAINNGASTVKDPNSIIFLMDLHITIPPCFFDVIRKHTIKGKASFFPEVFRLECSTSDIYPEGEWDLSGYGLLGIYKEDWDRFGGENAKKYKYKWGGEDWDLLDRVINANIESERFKWQKLFHFHHSKKGSWYRL